MFSALHRNYVVEAAINDVETGHLLMRMRTKLLRELTIRENWDGPLPLMMMMMIMMKLLMMVI